MFISDDLIYLALHKTGCSHILKLLTTVDGLNGKIIGKHNTIYDVSNNDLGDLSKKIKSGNIRNPWDWYVSLWAFGSMKKGGLYEQTVKKQWYKKINHPRTFLAKKKEWHKVYSNPEDMQLFRQWLKMLLKTRRTDIVRFGGSNVPTGLGYMTFRYLDLYSYDFNKIVNQLNSFEKLTDFDNSRNFIDHFIYSNNLENNFLELMQKLNVNTSHAKNVMNIPKTNTSNRKHYREYYDQETIDLVAEQDKLIITKHKFEI